MRPTKIFLALLLFCPATPIYAQKLKLSAGEKLHSGDSIFSPNLRFELNFQGDGNLVLSDRSFTPAKVVWASGLDPRIGRSAGKNGFFLSMQADGNLVLADSEAKAMFSSGTQDSALPERQYPSCILSDSDGDVIVCDNTRPVWTLNHGLLDPGDLAWVDNSPLGRKDRIRGFEWDQSKPLNFKFDFPGTHQTDISIMVFHSGTPSDEGLKEWIPLKEVKPPPNEQRLQPENKGTHYFVAAFQKDNSGKWHWCRIAQVSKQSSGITVDFRQGDAGSTSTFLTAW